MPIAFQPDAFQLGYPGNPAFQGFDRYVDGVFHSISPLLEFDSFVNGKREMNKYAKGATLVFQVRVYDPTEIPVLPFDPTAVELSVINPDGTALLTEQAMTMVDSGVYEYTYQTTTNNQAGVYQVNFLGTSGAFTHQSLNQAAFQLLVNA